jgi:hypothetical protein
VVRQVWSGRDWVFFVGRFSELANPLSGSAVLAVADDLHSQANSANAFFDPPVQCVEADPARLCATWEVFGGLGERNQLVVVWQLLHGKPPFVYLMLAKSQMPAFA